MSTGIELTGYCAWPRYHPAHEQPRGLLLKYGYCARLAVNQVPTVRLSPLLRRPMRCQFRLKEFRTLTTATPSMFLSAILVLIQLIWDSASYKRMGEYDARTVSSSVSAAKPVKQVAFDSARASHYRTSG